MSKLIIIALFALLSFSLKAEVFISKSNLNKNLIFNSYALKTNGLYNYSKAYNVKFHQKDKSLILKSDNQEIDYEFKILKSTKSGYVIDLRGGLSSVNFQSSIYKTELDLSHPQLKKYTIPAKAFSDINIIENSKKRLFLEIKINVPGYQSIHIEITDLKTNRFSKSIHSREELVGVYATYPNVNGEMFASKQSLVTTYLYDKNFPKELLAPLKSAVRYWNDALGAKRIILKKAKDKSQALKVGSHYIDYYADRDSDGGARGIFSLNPNSGQIISSYIYVPSGFKVWGKKYFQEKYPEISQANVDQIVLDYLTHTLAHEIGHTLGLRHNFAASTQSNITSQNYEAILSTYFSSLYVAEETVPATSSMDYISIEYFSLIGAKMRLKQRPLSYDSKAVQWLYMDQNIYEFGNFCTHFDEPPTIEDGGLLYCQAWDEPHLF